MTIRHHPTEALLAAYAAGTLPEAFDLAIATHLSMCDECRAAVLTLETAGGAILSRLAPVPIDEDEIDAMVAQITAMPAAPRDMRRRNAPDGLPAPLIDYIGGSLDAVRWRPVGLGVRQAVIPTRESGATARLLYIPPGQDMPDHGHNGLEVTLVLRGAFRDEGERFGPGDIEVADAALEHRPVAEPGEPCICLAVTDGRLKFRKLLPRLAQRFVGI